MCKKLTHLGMGPCAALKPFFCFLVTGPQAIIIPRIATALVVRMLCYGVLRF
jgi:hypothetical protein